ncbi:MAG: hypothetical protein E3J23_03460 [Candidatus Stahlbacteria bacterium]|nr:MAG: hypothetical protein E3J23_03460 [Candidatus Stahlbacteria bacterium]
MKKAIFIILFVCISLLMVNPLQAQEKRSSIGLGVSLGKELYMGGLTLLDFPTFYLPITLSSNFRIEPEIGYYRYSSEFENSETTETYLTVGCGIFLISQKGKTNIYYGLRLGFIRVYEYDKWIWNGQDVYEAHRTDYYIGPAIGGEYFFNKHLSLGGEIQVNFISIGKWSDSTGKHSVSVTRTKPLIFVRWYF